MTHQNKPLVTIDGQRGLSARPGELEYAWARAESERRGTSISSLVADCFRAYRKIVKDAAKVPSEPYPRPIRRDKVIPVDF